MSFSHTTRDDDIRKGAVEQDRPTHKTNVSFTGQSGHRDQDAVVKASDSDFPERGQNEEHTGEPQAPNQLDRDTDIGSEDAEQDQDPGFRQKMNQNDQKDDPLAA